MPQEETLRFLGNFRSKYPEYDDLDDATLLSNIQRKYPEYSDLTLDAPLGDPGLGVIPAGPQPKDQTLLRQSLEDPSSLSDVERKMLGMEPKRGFLHQFAFGAPREMHEASKEMFLQSSEAPRSSPGQALGALGVGMSLVPGLPGAIQTISNVAQTLGSGGAQADITASGSSLFENPFYPKMPEVMEASRKIVLDNFDDLGQLTGPREFRPSATGHESDAIDMAVDIMTGFVPLGEVAIFNKVAPLVAKIFGAPTLQASKIIAQAELDQITAAKILSLVESIDFKTFSKMDEAAVLRILAGRSERKLLAEGQALGTGESLTQGVAGPVRTGETTVFPVKPVEEIGVAEAGFVRPAATVEEKARQALTSEGGGVRGAQELLAQEEAFLKFKAGSIRVPERFLPPRPERIPAPDPRSLAPGRALEAPPENLAGKVIGVPRRPEGLAGDAAAALRREEALEQTRTVGGTVVEGSRPARFNLEPSGGPKIPDPQAATPGVADQVETFLADVPRKATVAGEAPKTILSNYVWVKLKDGKGMRLQVTAETDAFLMGRQVNKSLDSVQATTKEGVPIDQIQMIEKKAVKFISPLEEDTRFGTNTIRKERHVFGQPTRLKRPNKVVSNKDAESGARGTTFMPSGRGSYKVFDDAGSQVGSIDFGPGQNQYGARQDMWKVWDHSTEKLSSFEYFRDAKKFAQEMGGEVAPDPSFNLSVYDTGVPPTMGDIPKGGTPNPRARAVSEAAEADPVLANEATVTEANEQAKAMIEQLSASGRTEEAAAMRAQLDQAQKSMVPSTEDALRAKGFEKEANEIAKDLAESQKAIDEGRIARESIDPAAVDAKAEARIAEQKTNRPPGPVPASTITATQMKVLAKKAARLGLDQNDLAKFADQMGFHAPVPQTQDEFARLLKALDSREALVNTIFDPIVMGATSYGDARIAKALARILPESVLDMAKTANRELVAGAITQVAKMAEAGKEMALRQFQVMQRAPLRIGSMRVERIELLEGFDAGALEALRLRHHRGIDVGVSVLGKPCQKPLVKTQVPLTRIERADNMIRGQFDEVADEAVVHGFMERNAAGKDVPFRRRQNYFPVRVLQEVFTNAIKKKEFTKDAIKLLVSEGNTIEVAQARVADFLTYNNPLIKRNAHLEFSRNMNLPDKWIDRDYVKVVNDYFESAVLRLEEARAFGNPIYPITSKAQTGRYVHRTVSYPIAEQLLAKIGESSQVDQAFARKAFERWAGLNRTDPGVQRVSSFLRSLQAVSKLSPMTGALNLTQTFTSVPLQGSLRALEASLRESLMIGGRKGLKLKPEALLEAVEAGAVIDRTIDDIMSMAMGEGMGTMDDVARWYMDKIVRLRGTEVINRTMAAQAGKAEINGLVRRLMKNNDDTVVRRQMEKLNVSPDRIIERNGLLTRNEELGAMQEFSRKVNFTGDLRNNPFQAVTSGGKVVYQFKNFSMNQAKLFSREFGAQMLRTFDNPQEARRTAEMFAKLPFLGGVAAANLASQVWVRRIGKMMVAGAIFNEAIPDEDKAFMSSILELFMASATGSFYDAYYSVTHGIKGMVGFAGGPTVQEILSTFDVTVNRPGTLPRYSLQKIPTLGKFVPSEPRGSGRSRSSPSRTR